MITYSQELICGVRCAFQGATALGNKGISARRKMGQLWESLIESGRDNCNLQVAG